MWNRYKGNHVTIRSTKCSLTGMVMYYSVQTIGGENMLSVTYCNSRCMKYGSLNL